MSEGSQRFIDQYAAMDTRLLLQRYRAGGLLPEAEAALLLVLADRGLAGDALMEKGEIRSAPSDPPPLPRVGISDSRLRRFNLALKILIWPVAKNRGQSALF